MVAGKSAQRTRRDRQGCRRVYFALAEQPGIGSKYSGARASDVRRLYLGRVGYFLYYRASEDSLEILAFWHARPGKQPKL
jgi:plasmid stabilization system protein ParE